jgi:hypothetical protein
LCSSTGVKMKKTFTADNRSSQSRKSQRRLLIRFSKLTNSGLDVGDDLAGFGHICIV